jgi:hypothetical protein
MEADNFAHGATIEHPLDSLRSLAEETFRQSYRIAGDNDYFAVAVVPYMSVICGVLGYLEAEDMIRGIAEEFDNPRAMLAMADAVALAPTAPDAEDIRVSVEEVSNDWDTLMADMEALAIEQLYCDMSGDIPGEWIEEFGEDFDF